MLIFQFSIYKICKIITKPHTHKEKKTKDLGNELADGKDFGARVG